MELYTTTTCLIPTLLDGIVYNYTLYCTYLMMNFIKWIHYTTLNDEFNSIIGH